MARIFGTQEFDVKAGTADLLSFALYVRGLFEISPKLDAWVPPAVSYTPTRPKPAPADEQWSAWWTSLLDSAAADVRGSRGIDLSAGDAAETLDPFRELSAAVAPVAEEAIAWCVLQRRLMAAQQPGNQLNLATVRAVEAAARGRWPRFLVPDLKLALRILYLPLVGEWSGTFEPALILIGDALLGTPAAEQVAAVAATCLVRSQQEC